MQVKHIAALLLLAAIWGASFMFMGIAAPEFGVYSLVLIRTVLAAVVMLPFVFFTNSQHQLLKHWPHILIVGLLNTAVPFILFNYASLHLQVGVNAILNGTAPMFATLIAWLWLKEKITLLAVLGLLLGLGGVWAISMQEQDIEGLSVVPVLAALLATFCYGVAACYIKNSVSEISPITLAAGSQVSASLLLIPPTIATLPAVMPSMSAWLSAVALAVFGTGVAYLLYFYLIARVGPAKAITVAYLVPLFGIAWGVVLMGEVLSLQTIAGGMLIVGGVMLATGFIKFNT